MKRWATVITRGVILMIISCNAISQDKATKIAPGMIAPGFTVQQINGLPFTLDKKVTVIWFFSSWCSYLGVKHPEMERNCDDAAHRLKVAYKKFGEQFRWIGISFGSLATVKDIAAYRMKHGIPFAMAIDENREVWVNYGVRYVPTVIIVNQGKIVYRSEATLENLEKRFRKLQNVSL